MAILVNKPIVVINGVGRVGKDTFVSLCNEIIKCKNYSSVYEIKKIAKILGWNGEKDEKSRKFLSDLKLLSTNYSDFPYKCIKNAIKDYYMNETEKIMFIHIRDIPEIKRVKKDFGAITLLIENNRVPDITTNIGDRDVKKYNYDYIINNNGSIEDLLEKAKIFISKIYTQGA